MFHIRDIILFFFISLLSVSHVQAEAQRIISLAPNITELLFEIGAEKKLVATVEFSHYPDAARSVERVGNVFQLDWERILSLQPDMVIGWQGGTPQNVLERVKSLGLPLTVVSAGKLDSVALQLRQLGLLTGHSKQAEQLAIDYLKKLAVLKKKYSGRSDVRVFYEVAHRPLYTINGKQIISDAIHLCGGVNIFSELDVLAPQVSTESVLQRNPEVFIYSGVGIEAEEVFSDWRRWTQQEAVKRGHLFWINPDIMNQPTPRVLQGIEELCGFIDSARQLEN